MNCEVNFMEINKKCLEEILQHITKLIHLTDHNDIKILSKLTNMATSISAQLLALYESQTEE